MEGVETDSDWQYDIKPSCTKRMPEDTECVRKIVEKEIVVFKKAQCAQIYTDT